MGDKTMNGRNWRVMLPVNVAQKTKKAEMQMTGPKMAETIWRHFLVVEVAINTSVRIVRVAANPIKVSLAHSNHPNPRRKPKNAPKEANANQSSQQTKDIPDVLRVLKIGSLRRINLLNNKSVKMVTMKRVMPKIRLSKGGKKAHPVNVIPTIQIPAIETRDL
jgi:hypothetical protein